MDDFGVCVQVGRKAVVVRCGVRGAGEDFATVFQNQIARYHSSGTDDSPSILRGAV